MNKKIDNAICFAGGTGGHFVLHVCSHILQNTDIIINRNGSCHQRCHIKNTLFVADQYALDLHGLTQEKVYLQSLSHYDFILGHMRDLNTLSKLCNRVIYIDFNKADIYKFTKNLYNKTNTIDITEQTYNILKGTDWPEYGHPLPQYIIEEIKELNIKHYKDWLWLMPEKPKNLFKIDFSNLLDFGWIDSLFDFFEVVPTNQKLQYIKQKQLDYKNAQPK